MLTPEERQAIFSKLSEAGGEDGEIIAGVEKLQADFNSFADMVIAHEQLEIAHETLEAEHETLKTDHETLKEEYRTRLMEPSNQTTVKVDEEDPDLTFEKLFK